MSNEQVENRVIDLNININIGHSDDSNDTRSPNISIIPTVESVDSTKTDEVSIKLNAEYVNEYDDDKEEDERSEGGDAKEEARVAAEAASAAAQAEAEAEAEALRLPGIDLWNPDVLRFSFFRVLFSRQPFSVFGLARECMN